MFKWQDMEAPRARTIKVVYIVGEFRSGSTLLAVLLGSHPKVFAAGELAHLWSLSSNTTMRCSCGSHPLECPFWSAVDSRNDAYASPSTVKGKRTRLAEVKDLFSLALHRLVVNGPSLETLRLEHECLVSIADVSQCPIIVDSSKDLARGLLYQLMQKDLVDVVYVHLVRDGRAVTWSLNRSQRPVLATREEPARNLGVSIAALGWVARNLLSAILFNYSREHYVRVRYEDLLTAPNRELEKIGRRLGIDLSAVAKNVSGQSLIFPGHVLAGNRMSRRQYIRPRLDSEWESEMPQRDQRLFWLIGGWLAILFGYHRKVDTQRQ